MKKLLAAIFAAVIILAVPSYSHADEVDDAVEEDFETGIDSVLTDLDLNELDKYLQEIVSGSDMDLPTDAKELVGKIATGEINLFSPEEAGSLIVSALFSEFAKNKGFVMQIIIISIILALMNKMKSSFTDAAVSKATLYVAYTIICSLSISMVYQVIDLGRTTVDVMASITKTLSPTLFALLTAIGGINTGTVLKPAMAILTGSVCVFIKNVIFPGILISAVLKLVSEISTSLKLTGFSKMIESAIKWLIGIMLIVFLGIMAINGLSGAAFDGLSIKTAKYTIDKFVPIVGGMFSDTVDTIIACSVLVKNAVGVLGLFIIICLAAHPLITMIANIFLFKLASAIIEPFSGEENVKVLSSMSSTLTLIFSVVLVVVAMMFISVALLIGSANMNVMMR